MRVSLSLATLIACCLILFFSKVNIASASIDQQTQRLDNKEFILPKTAKFFPQNSSLTVHWLKEPTKPSADTEKVPSSNFAKLTSDEATQIRNGAFALVGLDFDKELADWIKPEVSFALFSSDKAESSFGWLIALTSKNKNGASNFLQRFWEIRSLTGTKIKASNQNSF